MSLLPPALRAVRAGGKWAYHVCRMGAYATASGAQPAEAKPGSLEARRAPPQETATRKKGIKLNWSPPSCAELLDPSTKAAITAYCNRLGPPLQMELDEEQRQAEERLLSWPLSRLQYEGLVLLGVSGRKQGSYFRKIVFVFTQANGNDLPFHRFSSGSKVTLSREHPLTEYSYKASVLGIGRGEMKVVPADRGSVPRGLEEGLWRVDMDTDPTPFVYAANAMRSLYKMPPAGLSSSVPQAVPVPEVCKEDVAPAVEDGVDDSATSQESPRNSGVCGGQQEEEEACESMPSHPTPKEQKPKQQGKKRTRKMRREEAQLPPGTRILDVLLSPGEVSAREAAAAPSGLVPQSGLEWAKQKAGTTSEAGGNVAAVAVSGAHAAQEDLSLGMNRSQIAGVATALNHRVSLLQGPPGTGKTSTIVRFLVMLKRNFGLKVPVLACAQSNVAVDNLLEGLTDAGMVAVRTGQPLRVRESLQDATVDARYMSHPLQAKIEKIGMNYLQHTHKMKDMQGKEEHDIAKNICRQMNKDIQKLKRERADSVFQGADVICTTCAGAGSRFLEGIIFPVVVLDEGSQCSEPEALIPLTKGASHVVLVGDHFQLPPTVQSQEAAAKGLQLSLFERLMQQGVPSALLQVQYRMHPALSAFPNTRFYAGRLVDGITPQQRSPPKGLRLPERGMPMVLVDVQGKETSSQSGSKSNKSEADGVARVVQALMQAGEAPEEIGVVTPYLSQVQLISNALRRVAESARGGSALEGAGSVEVKSVDGYQGREKGVIVFSAVRSNSQGQVGFLCDWRRMNVAITRAKRGLVVIGNARTLESGDPYWAALVQHYRASGCVAGAVAAIC